MVFSALKLCLCLVFVYDTMEKGIPELLGSDVNHDYIVLGMRQTFKIGTFGTPFDIVKEK